MKLRPRLDAFRHALRGLATFAAHGCHPRLQIVAASVTVIAGFILKLSAGEWMAVVLCIALVLAAEAFNSALEELADEVTLERSPRLRRAKDMAAAAVLICALASLAVAAIIVAQRL
ncbi:MAG: diacylglycerol kinase family protein [Puniceicoccales bacterium]